MTTDTTAPAPKRPILVWIIFLFYLITCLANIAQMFFITAGGVPLSPDQQEYLARFSMFDRVIGYIDVGVIMVGVTLLLALRHVAVPVLALALVLNLFSTVVVWIKANPMVIVSWLGLAIQAGGIVLFAAVVFYAWRLDKRGVLRGGASSRPRKKATA